MEDPVLYVYTGEENAGVLVGHRPAQDFQRSQKHIPTKRNERSSLAPPGRQRSVEKQQRRHQQPRPLANRKGSRFTELREEKAGGMQEILTQQHADLGTGESHATWGESSPNNSLALWSWAISSPFRALTPLSIKHG